MRGGVFLDRDGVLVRGMGNRPANTVDEIELLPTVVEGMRELGETGLQTVVVTNQAGIALGYMTEAMLCQMNKRMNDLLVVAGAPRVRSFYWCAHASREFCECRKPRPGMLLKAAEDLGIDLAHSYMIGDEVSDMEAAVYANVKWPLMVVSDRYQDTPMARMIFPTFKDATHAVAMLETLRK